MIFMEISMGVPQEVKNRHTYDPAIPLLNLYPKECKSTYRKDTCTPVFIAVLVTIARLFSTNQ
jgi:hypothetical protein